jgi:hypothetical protein
MDDLLSVFIAETSQSLDEGEVSFKAIQKAPGDHGAIDNLLRLMNSIRETSGFLGLPALNAMAVMAVDQLTQLRSSKGTDAWERIPAVKESLRVLRALLSDLAQRSGAPEAAKAEPKPKEAKLPKEPVAKEPAAKEPKEAKPDKGPFETKPKRAAKAPKPPVVDDIAEDEELPPAKPVKAAKSKPAPAPAPEPAPEPLAPPVAAAPAPLPPAPEPDPAPQAVQPVAEAPAAPAAAPVVPPAPPAADVAPAAAAAAQPMAGAVIVQAQTLENLLSTVNNLMVAQAEMIQLMRGLGVTMPRGGSAPKSSARPPSEPKILANRPRVDNGAQPTADAATRAPASTAEETAMPNGNVVRLRDRRGDSGTDVTDPAPLPPVKTQMLALEEAAEAQLDSGAPLQLFIGANGRIRTVEISKVGRVAEVDVASIDSSRALWMAEIDELLVPLVACDRDLALPEKGNVPVIVLSFDGQWLGLMTSEIGSVTSATVDTSYADLHAGRAGLATVNGQDLEVIEPAYYLAEALRQRTRGSPRRAATKQKRSTVAAAAIMAEADDLFVRKPGQ